jgi:hypothetical protein
MHRNIRTTRIQNTAPVGECLGILGPGDAYGACISTRQCHDDELTDVYGGNNLAGKEFSLDLCAREQCDLMCVDKDLLLRLLHNDEVLVKSQTLKVCTMCTCVCIFICDLMCMLRIY